MNGDRKSISPALSMPAYQAAMTLPMASTAYFVLRYYAPWGDGSADGWQVPVNLPTVSIEGTPAPVTMSTWFSYSKDYLQGQVGEGFDQHAQYYAAEVYASTGKDSQIVFSGTFQQAAYYSATAYIVYPYQDKGQIEVLDLDLTASPAGSNPYIVGNPSVFAYPPSLPGSSAPLAQPVPSPFADANPPARPELRSKVNARTGEISVFRPDQQTSASQIVDELAPDGCSKAYLYATKAAEQQVLILRIKVPTTFVHNSNPDTVFGEYQCREITVGAHTVDTATLDFWTVSSRMLTDYVDADGYAYVFFAPVSYTQSKVVEQGTPATRAPVMTWGQYTGYLLGDPDYAVIIRYRAPADDWVGNPQNAFCYATPEDEQPVTAAQLQEYLPEIFGDTLANFEQGQIGAVHKDRAWPAQE